MLVQATHMTRTVWHGCHGAASAFLYGRVIRLAGGAERHLLDSQYFERWLQKLGALLRLEVVVTGAPLLRSGLFAANHISWLDALAFLQLQHFSFVAKTEVRHWPLIGALTELTQTTYIDRRNKFSVYRSLPDIEAALNNGLPVLFFPEGTTTCGERILPFHPMLFETAIRTGHPVQCLTLRYCNTDGIALPQVGFIDDDTFFDTYYRLQQEPRVIAQIHIGEPIDSRLFHRKHLAQECYQQMTRRLTRMCGAQFNFADLY